MKKQEPLKKNWELSLKDNNRSPEKTDFEKVKLKRPKAETAKDLVPKNQKEEGFGLGGQMVDYD